MRLTTDALTVCILECVRKITRAPLEVGGIGDDLDLLAAGILDSLGYVQLLGELEARLRCEIDLSDMDPNHLGRVGSLAKYIADAVAVKRMHESSELTISETLE